MISSCCSPLSQLLLLLHRTQTLAVACSRWPPGCSRRPLACSRRPFACSGESNLQCFASPSRFSQVLLLLLMSLFSFSYVLCQVVRICTFLFAAGLLIIKIFIMLSYKLFLIINDNKNKINNYFNKY